MAQNWPARNNQVGKAFEKFCRFVLKNYCPLEVHGQEKLPREPYIMCSNHQSHMDSPILMIGTGLAFKDIGLIAAKDYFFDMQHRGIIRTFLNLIPIARGLGQKAIQETAHICQSFLTSGGKVLIIFPEGTRSLTGQMGTFKQGPAILAKELNLPIVPAYISGSFEAMPKGVIFIRKHKISLTFGDPINLSDFIKQENINPRRATIDAYKEAIAILEKRIKTLGKL